MNRVKFCVLSYESQYYSYDLRRALVNSLDLKRIDFDNVDQTHLVQERDL